MTLTRVRFGNTYSLRDGVVQKRTLAGELKVFSSSDRITIEQFRVEMNPLTTAEVDAFREFFFGAAAQQIRITDHDGIVWVGFITGSPVIAEGKGTCDWSVCFEFEGKSYPNA